MNQQEPSVKRNFVYNGILTLSNYIFPLIVYPYVSRVLGVSNIGICNFVDSVVHWFILFSMMGMTILGNREMAAIGNDRERRSKAFSELIVLNLVTTLIATAGLLAAMYTVPKLIPYRSLLYVGVVKLFANFLCIDWYFRGTENFRYITGRTIFVKSLYVVAVFLLVQKADDYLLYYLLTVLMLAANALINLFYARRSVSFIWKGLQPKQYLKPFMMLGMYMLLTALYVTLNVTWLGFVADETQVGYYTTASKLYSIVIAFFTAFTGVMLPRMSSLVSENRLDDFRSMIDRTFDLLFTFAVPLVVYASLCAPEIVRIFAGSGYEGAYLPARIMMPLILVVGLEQIYVIQILMPNNRDRSIFVNSCVGAFLGILLNVLLVSRLKAVGSAIVWLSCETAVLVAAARFSRRDDKICFPWRKFLREVMAYLPLAVVSIALYLLIGQPWYRLGAITVLTGVYTIVYVLFVKNDKTLLTLFHR
ncbi:MAG: flippase [Bacteroidales bacterium]|nr:flippase [Bacteroidales bacterium]